MPSFNLTTDAGRAAAQRFAIRRLLELTDENGRGYYPLAPLAADLGLTVADLYDNNTNTGLLWGLGRFGRAYIDVLPPGYTSACIVRDCESNAKRFAREPQPDDDLTFSADELAAAMHDVVTDLRNDINAQLADYEAVLRAIRDDDGTGDFCPGVAAREVLNQWSSVSS